MTPQQQRLMKLRSDYEIGNITKEQMQLTALKEKLNYEDTEFSCIQLLDVFEKQNRPKDLPTLNKSFFADQFNQFMQQ